MQVKCEHLYRLEERRCGIELMREPTMHLNIDSATIFPSLYDGDVSVRPRRGGGEKSSLHPDWLPLTSSDACICAIQKVEDVRRACVEEYASSSLQLQRRCIQTNTHNRVCRAREYKIKRKREQEETQTLSTPDKRKIMAPNGLENSDKKVLFSRKENRKPLARDFSTSR